MPKRLLLLAFATACGSGTDATTGRTTDDAASQVGSPGGSDAGPALDSSVPVVVSDGGTRYFGDPHSATSGSARLTTRKRFFTTLALPV